MLCPTCQTQNSEGQKFCGECGARLDGAEMVGMEVEKDDADDVDDRSTDDVCSAKDRRTVTCGGCGRAWCERCDPAPG